MRIYEITDKNNITGQHKLIGNTTTEGILRYYFDVPNNSLYHTNSYEISGNGSVSVKENCQIKQLQTMEELPIEFDKALKNFDCAAAGLLTLSGSPRLVVHDFNCRGNQLKSLFGGPTSVGGDFICNQNPLKSLEGFPELLLGRFWCTWTIDLPLLRSLRAKDGVNMRYDNGTYHPISDIINRFVDHTNFRHAILDCQKKLREAGYEGNARW
jgi:hypothetical protein